MICEDGQREGDWVRLYKGRRGKGGTEVERIVEEEWGGGSEWGWKG